MKREFAIRFVPPGDGCAVPIDVYVDALGGVREGLASLRHKFSQVAARRYGLKAGQISEALAISILPPVKGSNAVRVEFGDREAQFSIFESHPHSIEETFWRAGSLAITAAANGRKVETLSAAGADALARAGDIAAAKNIDLQLADRAVGSKEWGHVVSLCRVRAGLRTFKEEKAMRDRAETQWIGRIVGIECDPFQFSLKIDDNKKTIHFPERLRTKVQEAWSRFVVVDVEGEMNREREFVGRLDATDIEIIDRGKDVVFDFKSSFGSGSDIWSSPEAVEFIESLGHKRDE